MEKINKSFSDFFYLHFNIQKWKAIMDSALKILIPFIIIYLIIFTISLFKIFKKENINPLFALVPIYRFYLYYKIIGLPFILYFIPIVNVVMFIASPYRLAHQYKCNDFIKAISIFIPFIIIPYIAFSKLENRDKPITFKYYKNEEDIDNLEKKLLNNDEDIYVEDEDKYVAVKTNKKNEIKSDDFIDQLDYSKSTDEYVDDEELIQETKVEEIQEEQLEEEVQDNNEEFEEIEDEENSGNGNIIDQLDEKLSEDKNELKLNTNIKDYQEEAKDKMDIAFGGEQEKAKISVQTKEEGYLCPKCGTKLTGGEKTCPGCENIIKGWYKC